MENPPMSKTSGIRFDREFGGKRALITGGTKGVGEAVVRRLGATVATTTRSPLPEGQAVALFVQAVFRWVGRTDLKRLPSWWHSWHRTELLRSPAASMSSMAGQFRRCELSPTSDYQTRGCGACQRESGGDQHNQTKSGNEGFID